MRKKQYGSLDPLDFYNETAAARVGHRIRKIRTEKDMTQADLGEAVGLNADRIQQYENGFRKPKAELLKKIAGALGVSTLSLVDPTTTSLVGSMYAFFELEELFKAKVEKSPGDDNAICLSINDRSELYPYMKAWLEVCDQVNARLEASSSDKDRDRILQSYRNWKRTYPQSALDSEDSTQAKEELLKKIRALQEAYDKL